MAVTASQKAGMTVLVLFFVTGAGVARKSAS
jgi:hypothetical protein